MVLLGLAKHCKRTATRLNPLNNSKEQRSTAVYAPIAKYLDWIRNILGKRCDCGGTTQPILEATEAIIFNDT